MQSEAKQQAREPDDDAGDRPSWNERVWVGAGWLLMAFLGLGLLLAITDEVNQAGSGCGYSGYYDDCPDRIYGAHPYADGC